MFYCTESIKELYGKRKHRENGEIEMQMSWTESTTAQQFISSKASKNLSWTIGYKCAKFQLINCYTLSNTGKYGWVTL